MIVTWRGPLRIGELWFDEKLSGKFDIAKFIQRSDPVDGACVTPKHTVLVDLTPTVDILFAAMKKEARYEIRRAGERDALTLATYDLPHSAAMERFNRFHSEFAAQKGLASFSMERLQALSAAGVLRLSEAGVQGESLVWHSYVCTSGRARLLHSASLFRALDDNSRRKLVGRANRWLHWQDMLHFKTLGYGTYDFGGWYAGTEHEELLRINRFKEQFGGRIVRNYNCELGVSTLGKLALALKQARRKMWQ